MLLVSMLVRKAGLPLEFAFVGKAFGRRRFAGVCFPLIIKDDGSQKVAELVFFNFIW